MADYVTVSTQKLKEALISLNENIFVLPNLLDDTLWPFHLPIRQTKAKSITIGYMGGESHKPDIEWITPVLEKINHEFSEEVNFHFYGIKPPEKFLSQSNVSHTELKTYHYKEFIDDFYHFDVDIFIAPLINNLFNQCKSPIKYLEYGTMGAPGVFTDIEPYRNIVADGKNGLLAKSQDEWFDKLMTLIQYPDLRYELAKNAQETVRSNWLMSENAHLWTDTYKNFIQMGPQQTTVRAEKEIIDTISRQLYEYHQHQQTIIAEKDGINKILEDRERLIENQSEQLLHQESNIQSLSDKFHKQEQELQNLRNLVTDRDASIQLLNEKIKEIEGYNITLSTKLSLKGELVQSLDEKLSMMDKELSSLNSQLTEKTKEIENLEAHLKNLREEFESKNALVQQKTQIVSELEEQINNQKIENDSLEAKLSRLEEEVLFYSLSKSWRFTRPIRNLKKLFTGGKHD
jgi:predicted  nucleic acid-binding Zn-ribbon protein